MFKDKKGKNRFEDSKKELSQWGYKVILNYQ